MSKDVVSLVFPGESHELLLRYAEGAAAWRRQGGTDPDAAVIAHGEDGLMVTLVWGEGIDHEGFGRHMLSSLQNLDLPFPRIAHGKLSTTSWDDLIENPSATR